MGMKYDVFISYSSKDQKVAEGICGYLERYGLRCFVAYRDIPKGKVWAEAIADGIDDSAMMVVVFSQNFNRSKQVDREIELAAEDNKPILTYRITDDPLQGAKKYYLKNLNWIDAFPNPQENFGKLYTNVCQLLGKKPLTAVNNQPQPKPQPKSLLWLWILLGVLVFGGVAFVVKSEIEKKRERERIAAEQQAAADDAFFQNCNDVADYRSYLNKYPDGLNAELAKNKIGRHVADSTAKAQEAERQRQMAAEAERKVQEAERQRQMAAEAERKAREAERQRQIAAENERKAREEAARFKDKTFTVNGVSFEMVAVNGGTFTMGATSEQGSDVDSDEKPTHSVTLSDYYIGKFEVTQELWEAVMGSNPSYFKGSKLPVERVSWYDAVEFCNRLSEETGRRPYYSIDKKKKDPDNKNENDDLKWTVRVNPGANGFRLPTEAEWEYAARGGNRSRGYKYSGSNNISDVAWYWENSGDRVLSGEWDYDKIENNNFRTHPVGMKSPNEFGIYDMSGNVFEYCQDWYGDYVGGSQTNPLGPSSGSYRVLRGGVWYGSARSCCVSNRGISSPYYGGGGLRLAIVL